MKRLLIVLGIIAFLEIAWISMTPVLTNGQSSWPPPIISTSNPTGGCANGILWVNITTPALFYCGGSVWNSAGGGGGTPGGTTGQIQYNNSGAFGGINQNAFDSTRNVIQVSPNCVTGQTNYFQVKDDGFMATDCSVTLGSPTVTCASVVSGFEFLLACISARALPN